MSYYSNSKRETLWKILQLRFTSDNTEKSFFWKVFLETTTLNVKKLRFLKKIFERKLKRGKHLWNHINMFCDKTIAFFQFVLRHQTSFDDNVLVQAHTVWGKIANIDDYKFRSKQLTIVIIDITSYIYAIQDLVNCPRSRVI